MKGYLGETVLEISKSECSGYTKEDWVLLWIGMYGTIDGAHHKDWLLDQIARILNDVEIIINEVKWANSPTEYRFSLGSETKKYKDWVKKMCSGEDGPNTYTYNVGIAP